MQRFEEIWCPEYRWGMDTPTIPVVSFSQPIPGVGRKKNLGLPQPSEISHGAQVDDTDRRVSELRLLPRPDPEPDPPYGPTRPDPFDQSSPPPQHHHTDQHQPPYGYGSAWAYDPELYQQQHAPSPYNRPWQQDRVWSYQLHRPSLPPLPIINPTSCWGPPRQSDPFGHPQFDQHQPLSSPMHHPTCWEPPGQQGYPEYEQSSPIDWLSSQLRLEPPLPAAYDQPPPADCPPPSPPYQPPYNSVTEPLGMPCDPVMPNSESNLPLAALVSQVERLTAEVEQMVSQMDANERRLGDPHAATRPSPAPPLSPYLPAQPHSFHSADQPWQQMYQFGVPSWEEPTPHSQPPGSDTQPWQQPPDPPDWQRNTQLQPYGSHDFGATDLVAHGHTVAAVFSAETYTIPVTMAPPCTSLTDQQLPPLSRSDWPPRQPRLAPPFELTPLSVTAPLLAFDLPHQAAVPSSIKKLETNMHECDERTEIQVHVDEQKAASETTKQDLEVGIEERRMLFKDELGLESEELVQKGGAELGAFVEDEVTYVIPKGWTKSAFLYVDLHVGDVASMKHRSTSLDADARLIPPRIDTPFLSILERVDMLLVVALKCHDHNAASKSAMTRIQHGPPLVILDGYDEGRRIFIRCVFDPGGDTSPRFSLSPLFVASWFPP